MLLVYHLLHKLGNCYHMHDNLYHIHLNFTCNFSQGILTFSQLFILEDVLWKYLLPYQYIFIFIKEYPCLQALQKLVNIIYSSILYFVFLLYYNTQIKQLKCKFFFHSYLIHTKSTLKKFLKLIWTGLHIAVFGIKYKNAMLQLLSMDYLKFSMSWYLYH